MGLYLCYKTKIDRFNSINQPHFPELVRLFYYSFLYDPSLFPIHAFVLANKIVSINQLLLDLLSISDEGKEYFLSSYQPISTSDLDKMIVYWFIFGQCHDNNESHDILSQFLTLV